MKKKYLFIIWIILFSFLIFFLKDHIFNMNYINENIEEKYIEPVKNKVIKNKAIKDKRSNSKIKKQNNKATITLKSIYKINFEYFPDNFKNSIFQYIIPFNYFLNSDEISNKIENIKIEFHEDVWQVRWKMAKKTIKLFWIKNISINESLSVLIHEFGHFIDLYFFKKTVLIDISNYFYEISWKSTKILKSNMKQIDFVSGYSMTNKYEDFAESFVYYTLHNKDFLEKTKKSNILKKKYLFFKNYLFKKNYFVNTNFSSEKYIKDYYWDITKIDFSRKNFLQFLKN